MTAARLLAGGCLCGRVRYRVSDAFEYSLICHCSDCRRATGAANKPFAGIAAELLTVEGEVLRYGDGPSHDARCGRCGSLLFSIVRDGAWAHVTLGTLIDEPSIRPGAHIFVRSKAGWEQIGDDLPQFDRFPPPG